METRARGYAVEDGTVTPGRASVAVAVVDHSGHPVAGVAVTFPESERAREAQLAERVRRVAAALSARLAR
jgi:DNA-binding IclR family transcriptional regulator